MSRNSRKIIVVTGRLSFPLDMLRRDSCWPYRSEDASAIRRSINYESPEGMPFEAGSGSLQCEVTLMTDSPSAPTVDRWRSFGWQVKEVRRA